MKTTQPPFLVLAVAILAAPACVTMEAAGLVPYVPPSAAVAPRVADHDILEAARENAEAQGWEVVLMDRARSRMEALTPVDSSHGLRTRERWMFSVKDARLVVEMRLEAADGYSNHWHSAPEVCFGYEYAREADQLERVNSLAARTVDRQLAQAR